MPEPDREPGITTQWDPRWRRQRAVVLEEPVGLDRVRELMEIPIDVAGQSAPDFERSLRVVARTAAGREFEEIPSQAIGIREAYGGLRATVLFEATVPARGTQDVLICYDNPGAPQPAYPTDLGVRRPGAGLGYQFGTAGVRATLDPASGQLATLQPSWASVPPFSYRREPVHWNPDVVPAPPRQEYYNVRRWDPPPEVSVDAGPLAAVIARSGPLAFRADPSAEDDPGVPEVNVAITYTFLAGQSHVVQTSAVTALEDVQLHALRNGGELTYGPDNFTDAVWEDEAGRLLSIPLGGMADRDIDARRGGRIARRPAWFAMVDRRHGVGMAVLFLRDENLDPASPSGLAPMHNDGLYLFSALEGDFYFRAPIWEFALYDRERAPAVTVPAGCVYYERNVLFPFRFDSSDLDEVRSAYRRFRHPLLARYELRDDRELRNLPEPGLDPRPFALDRPGSRGFGDPPA